jgi:hypothetical protein
MADIHLIAKPDSSQEGVEFCPQPEDRSSGADELYGNRVEGELDAVVFHREAHEAGKEVVQFFRAKIDGPKQIDVARGPGVRTEPMAKQEPTLEDKLVALWRSSQPVEEALDGEELQQLGEWAATFLRLVLEAVLNRVDEALRLWRAH